jgi:hypothetical protein
LKPAVRPEVPVAAAHFDTLKLTKALREKAHFTQERLTEALSDSIEEQIATKLDISNLEAKRESLEQCLIIKMGGMLIVAIGVLTGLMKLVKMKLMLRYSDLGFKPQRQ